MRYRRSGFEALSRCPPGGEAMKELGVKERGKKGRNFSEGMREGLGE